MVIRSNFSTLLSFFLSIFLYKLSVNKEKSKDLNHLYFRKLWPTLTPVLNVGKPFELYGTLCCLSNWQIEQKFCFTFLSQKETRLLSYSIKGLRRIGDFTEGALNWDVVLSLFGISDLLRLLILQISG